MNPASDPPMNTPQPAADLGYIRDVLARTQRAVDPHAFHAVHWGTIVALWYPSATALRDRGLMEAAIAVHGLAILLGFALSIGREMRLRDRPRIAGESSYSTRQLIWVVYLGVGAGTVLSAVAPTFGLIDGRNVPILWGCVYSYIACMMGLLYHRQFLWGGVAIFAAVVAAIVLQEAGPYFLGPVMGLGMVLPGLAAERRVRRRMDEEQSPATV